MDSLHKMIRPTVGLPLFVGILVLVLIFQVGLLFYDMNRVGGEKQASNQSIAPEMNNRMGRTSPPLVSDDPERAKATFVILCRNTDLGGITKSLGALEKRFNHRYNYPYTFLNDVPFTDEFKKGVRQLTKSPIQFGELSKEAWGMPEWIDSNKAADTRIAMKKIIYGGSESYRYMCRFNSGYFFRHPLLAGFEYYWRVEPDVDFVTDIPYDPFVYMKKNDLVYGFTIMLPEYMETIKTLWQTTKDFMEKHKDMIPNYNTMKMVTGKDGNYNGCHFWSNFEIARLDFFNSKEYMAYFEHLDRAGGFFYERWGDAPVHTLGLAMLLPPEKIHYFEDIGYFHPPFTNCPSNPILQLYASCDSTKSVNRNNRCLKNYKDALFEREP